MAVLGLLLALARGVSGLSWGSASLGTTEHLQDVAFANGIFVAVGHNGTILTSANGSAWSPQASGTTVVLNGAASSNGVPGTAAWVVVGHAGTILYSTASSASTWLQVPAGSLPPGLGGTILEQVTFGGPSGGQQYVAVGWGGMVLTSPNGTNWTQQTSGTAANLADVEYGSGQYVIAGWNGTILTSANGTGWTPRSSGTTANLYDLAYGAGTWVAVGSQGTILYSSNGVNWSPANAGTSNDLYDVIYDGCRFVAAGAGGTILTSPDGVTWTPDTSGTAAALYGLGSGGGVDIAVGYTGGTVLVAKAPCQPAGAPDLAIVKRAAGTPWQVGGTGNFTISVSNAGSGPVPAGTAVTVTENLPAGLTLTGVSGSGWTCTPASGSGPLTVTCTYTVPAGGLAAGASLPPINFTVQVDKPGPYTNCATVSGTLQGAVLQEPTGNNKSCVDISTGGSSGGKCAPLPTGAVAWWPLNEATGATAVADSVGGHTGTPVSGPVGSGGPNPTTGMVGGALYFTSQSTYVRVPDHPALNFGTGDFTVDAWINPVQVGPGWYQPIVDKAQALATKGGVQGYRLYVKNGQAIFALADGSTTAVVSAPVTYGAWQFVAAERTGTNLNLYINGALAATAPLPAGFGSVSNTADLLVGGITGVGTPVQPIVGEIGLDEVELFNRALTAQEVQALYNAGPAGKCPPAPPAPKPDLAIAKKPTGPLTAGQQASYQIAVSNVGTAPASGPVVVTDTLGAGLTYVSATGSGWTCSASGQTVTCTHPGPVPAGGSLAPVTLTVQVAPDAKEVKNCASVKIVKTVVKETLGGPLDIEVPVPDANPANDEACDVSPVGAGPEKPGMICGVKFLDHDGDGQQDPGEPGLPNWTIQVKDAAGNVVKAVTGKKGRFCLEVKPGTYTVSEVLPPGWVQTAPPPVPPGTATVTVAAGQTAFVAFGNRPEKQPCCLGFTLEGGKPDQFSTADGATAEPASPPPGKPASYFDQTAVNQAFWHRFTLPAGNCIREAKLEILLKPLRAETDNDRIYLYSGSGSWVANLGSGSGNPGGADLLPSPWTVTSYGGGQLFTLDLAALPLPGSGTTSLLGALDANRVLDLAVQDDTSVDYARLTVRFCDCAQGEAQAQAAEAKPTASEVRLAVGKPQLVADGMDREIDTPPVVRGGRTFLPVRALAEALGLDVAWDPAERRVTLTTEDPPTAIELWVGRPEAKLTKADAARGMAIDPANPDVAPFVENGRVMLPVRFIAEALGLDVGFDPPTQQITIKTKRPRGSANVEVKPGY